MPILFPGKIKADWVLGSLKRVEEVEQENLWCSSPPFSAEYDHFKEQQLKGEYKVVFEAHPLLQV